jgi:hypothetical protein
MRLISASRAKWIAWAAVVAAGAVGAALALAGASSPLRAPLVILFLVAAPATAVAGLLRGFDTFARVIVAATAAIVINALVATAMLAAGVRSPRAGLVVIVLITAVCMAVQLPPVRHVAAARLRALRATVRRLSAPSADVAGTDQLPDSATEGSEQAVSGPGRPSG